MDDLPLFGDELPIFGDELPNLSGSTFVNMLNDSSQPLNLEITLENVLNPRNEEERLRHRSLAKRRMPYMENRHIRPTETISTLSGIHFTERGCLAFLFRMFGGDYWEMQPQTK